MKILRNYLLKEFFSPFILSFLILTFVMLLGNMVKLVDMIINKGVSILLVFELFALYIPDLASYTLPVAFLIAILFAFSRLSSDNEVLAIRTSGINLINIISPFLAFGIVLSLFLFIINDRITSRTHLAAKRALTEVGIKNPAAALEAGTFINSFERYILFIYDINGNKLTNVRIYEPQEGKPTRTIVAKRGEFISLPLEKKIKLKLINGTSDEINPKDPANYYKLQFKTFFMTLNLAGQNREIDIKPKNLTVEELFRKVKELSSQGIETQPLLTEMQKRMAFAASPFIFALVGCPIALALGKGHRKRSSFVAAFIIVLIYFVLILGMEALTLQFSLPAILMWLPDVLCLFWGLILTFRICVY
ncbi:MAG: LptF/LptG family permease [Candidatus Omnitrophota bacterium]